MEWLLTFIADMVFGTGFPLLAHDARKDVEVRRRQANQLVVMYWACFAATTFMGLYVPDPTVFYVCACLTAILGIVWCGVRTRCLLAEEHLEHAERLTKLYETLLKHRASADYVEETYPC